MHDSMFTMAHNKHMDDPYNKVWKSKIPHLFWEIRPHFYWIYCQGFTSCKKNAYIHMPNLKAQIWLQPFLLEYVKNLGPTLKTFLSHKMPKIHKNKHTVIVYLLNGWNGPLNLYLKSITMVHILLINFIILMLPCWKSPSENAQAIVFKGHVLIRV